MTGDNRVPFAITNIADNEASIPASLAKFLQGVHFKIPESFFSRIKQFRRINRRFDKLATRFASFVAFAAAAIWLA